MRRAIMQAVRTTVDLREWPATGVDRRSDPWFDDRAQQLSFTFVHALCASGGVVFDVVTDVEGRDVILRGRSRPDPRHETVIPAGQVDVQMKSVRSVLRSPAVLPAHVLGPPQAYLRYRLRLTDYERLRLTPVGAPSIPFVLFVVQIPTDARLWCVPPRHGSAQTWSKLGARGWWVNLSGYPASSVKGDHVPVYLPRRQSLTVSGLQKLVGL